tara:strand:+ start:1951 stop:2499 length:549 start_codon:yes stop_codon:yes gene_type:complete
VDFQFNEAIPELILVVAFLVIQVFRNKSNDRKIEIEMLGDYRNQQKSNADQILELRQKTENLNDRINSLVEENSELKIQMSQKDLVISKIMEINDELSLTIDSLKVSYSDIIKKRDFEVFDLTSKRQKLEKEVHTLNGDVNSLILRVDALEKSLKEKVIEIQNLKTINEKLSTKLKQYEDNQ